MPRGRERCFTLLFKDDFIDRIMHNPVRTLPWGVDSSLVKGAARSRGFRIRGMGDKCKVDLDASRRLS
jgi:hypothetical protein